MTELQNGSLFDTIVTLVAVHFVDGDVFFLGIAALITASVVKIFFRKTARFPLSRLGIFAGVILVGLSSTPLPLWFYCLWGIAILGALFDRKNNLEVLSIRKNLVSIILIVLSLIAAMAELPYHMQPSIPIGHANKIIVIGDSISAGIGNESELWPAILQSEIGIRVINISEPGLKVAGAAEKAGRLEDTASESKVIILEIGGNDILGKTEIKTFEMNLDRIFDFVSRRANTIIVLELPLPPFCNRYGRIQRRLAKKYGAHMIPKRYFAGVITSPEATVDGLHLSPIGHQMFAEMICENLTSLGSPK